MTRLFVKPSMAPGLRVVPGPSDSPAGPDVEEAVSGEIITAEWGISVAADLAELHQRTDALAAARVTDGDKGDVTVSASGATWTVDANAVSNAKLVDVASGTIKGRTTSGVGDPEDLTAAAVKTLLALTKGDVGLSSVDNTNDVSKPVSIAQAAADATKVDKTTTIATTAPLTGGGDLSASRTLAVAAFGAASSGVVPASGGGTANYLRADATWAAPPSGGAPIRRTIKADTTTGYAPILTDENQMVTLSNAAAITVTLPQDSAVAFPVGAEVDFLWLGVGQPTFAAGTGATVGGTPGLKLRAQYSAATAKKISTNGWVIIGDLSA